MGKKGFTLFILLGEYQSLREVMAGTQAGNEAETKETLLPGFLTDLSLS